MAQKVAFEQSHQAVKEMAIYMSLKEECSKLRRPPTRRPCWVYVPDVLQEQKAVVYQLGRE